MRRANSDVARDVGQAALDMPAGHSEDSTRQPAQHATGDGPLPRRHRRYLSHSTARSTLFRITPARSAFHAWQSTQTLSTWTQFALNSPEHSVPPGPVSSPAPQPMRRRASYLAGEHAQPPSYHADLPVSRAPPAG